MKLYHSHIPVLLDIFSGSKRSYPVHVARAKQGKFERIILSLVLVKNHSVSVSKFCSREDCTLAVVEYPDNSY